MSDDLTIHPFARVSPAFSGNAHWEMEREIKKQESLHPQSNPAEIKNAIELAFQKANGDRKLLDRYVALFLKV